MNNLCNLKSLEKLAHLKELCALKIDFLLKGMT